MKHLAVLLSSLCLLVAPTLPARASLATDVAAVDNWQCLVWLLTDPDAHAANCGGPFHLDDGKDSLSPGSFGPCQYVTSIDLTQIDFLGRIEVAQSQEDCCYRLGSAEPLALTFGEQIDVAAQYCDD